MAFKAKTGAGHRSHTTDEAIAEAIKEPQKSIIVNVPESVHRQFKTKASANGDKMKDVLIAAVMKYIKK